MNYKKHYTLLIEKHGTKDKPEGYSERHHIVPKCIGGSDDEDNLVYLSARCHFLAHALLSKIYTDTKLLTAYWLMANAAGNKMNSLSYERLRIAYAKSMLGRKHPRARVGDSCLCGQVINTHSIS